MSWGRNREGGRRGAVVPHTAWNVAGYVLPLGVALATLPPTVRLLGPQRFGLLALVLLVHDYFGYFDFGLGRATTWRLADLLTDPAGSSQARSLFVSSLAVHAVLGSGLGLLVLGGAPLVARFLSAPLALIPEARWSLMAAAALAPGLLLTSAARGGLEAIQRFDLLNLVRIGGNAISYAVPLVGAASGWSLPEIVLTLAGVRLATAGFLMGLCWRRLPGGDGAVDWKLGFSLLGFGGWVMASNVAGMLLVDGDRLLVALVGSVGALTFYSISQEVATRLWVLPASVGAALFPSLTRMRDDRAGRVNALAADASLYLLLAFVPVVVGVVALGREALGVWMGQGFADRAAIVLQVVTLGVAIDAVARIPLVLLQATGRPAIPARIRWVLVGPFLAGSAWAISVWGILGAAMTWTGRIAIEAVALFTAAHRTGPSPFIGPGRRRLQRGAGVSLLVVAVAAVAHWRLTLSLAVELGIDAALLLWFCVYAFGCLVDPEHRRWLGSVTRTLREHEAGPP